MTSGSDQDGGTFIHENIEAYFYFCERSRTYVMVSVGVACKGRWSIGLSLEGLIASGVNIQLDIVNMFRC